MPAGIWTPGDVTSGLMKSPDGPRDEKAAITSPLDAVGAPATHAALTTLWFLMNFTTALFWYWTCIVGSQWLSESRSVTAAVSLKRIIPAAPPWRTL